MICLTSYEIPTVNVKPHSTLTIVCKNNKSENTLMKMQTNFSLKTGETLILSNESGEILGKVAIIDCSKDESLVRQRDGEATQRVRRPLKRTANNVNAVHQGDARLQTVEKPLSLIKMGSQGRSPRQGLGAVAPVI